MKKTWYTRVLAFYEPIGPGHKDKMSVQMPPGFEMKPAPVFVVEGLYSAETVMQMFLEKTVGEDVPCGAKYTVDCVLEITP